MKILFLSLLSLCLFTGIKAQTHTEFGIKGGVNFADLKIEDGADLDMNTSLHLGVLGHIHLTKYFALQPELYYSGQGAKNKASDIKTNLSYINLPLLGQFMTGSGFRLQTGPQVGFLMTAKNKNGSDTDVKDNFKKIDFSWVFGASYLLESGIGFDARYNHGISNINDGGDDPKISNRVIALGLFYQFRR